MTSRNQYTPAVLTEDQLQEAERRNHAGESWRAIANDFTGRGYPVSKPGLYLLVKGERGPRRLAKLAAQVSPSGTAPGRGDGDPSNGEPVQTRGAEAVAAAWLTPQDVEALKREAEKLARWRSDAENIGAEADSYLQLHEGCFQHALARSGPEFEAMVREVAERRRRERDPELLARRAQEADARQKHTCEEARRTEEATLAKRWSLPPGRHFPRGP